MRSRRGTCSRSRSKGPSGSRRVVPASAEAPARPLAAVGVVPALGALIGWLAGSVLRIRRVHVERAMDRAGIARSFAPAMYRSLGSSLVELLWLTFRSAVPASRLASFDDDLRI